MRLLGLKGVYPYKDGFPAEVKFINMFHPDGGVLRQDPRFRQMVVETGLPEVSTCPFSVNSNDAMSTAWRFRIPPAPDSYIMPNEC